MDIYSLANLLIWYFLPWILGKISTSDSGPTDSPSSIMHPLIPVPSDRLRKGFTSSSSLAKSHGDIDIEHVPLDDSALGVHKVFNRTPHNAISPPVPSHPNPDDSEHPEQAWEAFYPRGSINPSASVVGGFGFYVAGPPGFLNGTVNEAIMSYRVMFESGWEWAKGGKLPGICEYRSLCLGRL